jgi:protocatechuate 3,4-dioxygenase beta subunit
MLVLLVSCDAWTSVRGKVSEADGRPVAGASVRLVAGKNGRTAEMTSQADGSFSVGLIHGAFAGRFQLVISKPGYVPFSRDIEAKTQQQVDVMLTPKRENPDSPR